MFEDAFMLGAAQLDFRYFRDANFRLRGSDDRIQPAVNFEECAYNYCPPTSSGTKKTHQVAIRHGRIFGLGRTRVSHAGKALDTAFLYNLGEDSLFDECVFTVGNVRQPSLYLEPTPSSVRNAWANRRNYS
jgi:hypothetical protein